MLESFSSVSINGLSVRIEEVVRMSYETMGC